MANRFFVMHFDLSTAKKLPLRITLTNLVKKPKVWARVIQYPLLPPSRWVQLCVHVPSIVGQFTKLSPTGNVLVSVQICSSLYLRALFTSDALYTTSDLPRPLRLDDVTASRPQEVLPWVYLPVGCRSSDCTQICCSSTDRSTPEPVHVPAGNLLGDASSPLGLQGEEAWRHASNEIAEQTPVVRGSLQLLGERRRPSEELFGARAVLQAAQVSGLCRPAQMRKCAAMWAGESRMLSCHSAILLHKNLKKKTSRCLLGHNGVIEFLEVTLEGALAATVENGSHHPAIRIWKLPPYGSESEDIRCAAIIQSVTVERISLLRLDPRGRYMVVSDRVCFRPVLHPPCVPFLLVAPCYPAKS